jgi:hypothetical protein
MCRTEKLYEEAVRLYAVDHQGVERGRVSWAALTTEDNKRINEVLKMCTEAAEQSHFTAQFNLGCMFESGLQSFWQLLGGGAVVSNGGKPGR